MRLTSLAIVFIMIIGPYLTISGIQSRMLHKDRELRAYYDQLVDNAVQDAVTVLAQQRRRMSDESGLTLQNTREIAVTHLFDALYYAFGVYGNGAGMMRVKGCMPVIVFLERDGFVVYALNEYEGPDGYTIMDYCWYPKKPYSGVSADGRYYVRYTLEDAVIVCDASSGEEMEGLFTDFTAMFPQFQTREGFEAVRLAAVSQAIEKDLASHIARFNGFSARMGVTYKFRFPRIEDADWLRALTDEGMLVFAQGFPVITGAPYENNAFGGARILHRPELVGYAHGGKLVYCRDTCRQYIELSSRPDFNQESLIRFTDARDAASQGYYPCPICRP
ncbi:MAG TPA: hypothetical protein PLD49_07795 [Thermoclostridium caenicola]|uniref:hypothetical protein n=1 Tax=Thermoclostridium caenicola TaxID=659425 RepID=UPI002C631964|nr:hypothetical protein [Thermoclostridium caenicola]HOK43551.1 hypothetical protein [Thermoclostridium caenicola]HOL84028.1 hypothetical protein [Thermoclostridium caenicola]HPO75610.1 hypothetical protein [Thermoclostridium caenicola]